MTTIRTMLIMTIIGSLVYNNARAMEKPNNLLSVDLIPIEFFPVHNKQEFNDLILFGNGVHPNFSPLYWYRVPTHFTITPTNAQTITSADAQRNFALTTKLNAIILQELGYSRDDLQKYVIRAKNGFNQRLQQALHSKNPTNYLQ